MQIPNVHTNQDSSHTCNFIICAPGFVWLSNTYEKCLGMYIYGLKNPVYIVTTAVLGTAYNTVVPDMVESLTV